MIRKRCGMSLRETDTEREKEKERGKEKRVRERVSEREGERERVNLSFGIEVQRICGSRGRE
jgi:hypothetical protein